MSSSASPEESKEFMELVRLKENEAALRLLLNESMQTENEYSLPLSSSEAVLNNIFENGKKNELTTGVTRRKRFVFATYTVAALVILLTSLVFYFEVLVMREKETKPSLARNELPVQKDIQPGSNKAILTLGNGARILLDSSAEGVTIGRPGVTLVNLHGTLTYQEKITSEAPPEFNTITVPRKGQYQLTLADGTKVWLNASSSLHFPSAFTGKERVVELTGEGYFEIAKDPERPFHVKAGNTDIQALGTHFNVMAYSNEGFLQATLLEGSVKVKLNESSGILKPGQAAFVFENSNHIEIKAADVDEVTAWKNGYFLFSGKTPLATIMRQMERWYDIQVNYEKGIIPYQNFGGGIQKSLPLSEVLTVLKESGIKFKIDNNTLTVSK